MPAHLLSRDRSRGRTEKLRAPASAAVLSAPASPPSPAPRVPDATGLYPIAGALLGLGAPLGLLALRLAARQARIGRRGLQRELGAHALLYGYLTVTTPIVFALFGHALGRRERQLGASHAQIERLREEFVAVVAHDLRNPVQSIWMQLDILLRGAEDGQIHTTATALHRLRETSRRLSQMIGDLLDASRIESRRLATSPQPIALPDAVGRLVERLRPTAGDHPIRIEVIGPPPDVLVDPGRLDQILTNLIENAATYSPAGAPITVRVAPARGGGLVEVRDEGHGIAAEDLGRLFDRFYQTKRAREAKRGLGLGLYIAKGLVEAHGGTIQVRSEPGRGSVFSVWLPEETARRSAQSAV